MKDFLRIVPFAVGFSVLVALVLERSGVYASLFGDNIKMLLLTGLALIILSTFKSQKLNPVFLAIQSACGFVGAGIWLTFLGKPFLRVSTEAFDILTQAIKGRDFSLISSNGYPFFFAIVGLLLLFLASRVAVYSWAKVALVGNRPLREELRQAHSKRHGTGLDGVAMFAGVFAGAAAASVFLDDQFHFYDRSTDSGDSSNFNELYSGIEENTGGFNYSDDFTDINPATGLPMVGGIGGIDVGGDVYGSSSIGDDFGSSSFDDSFSSSSFDD